MLIALSGSRPVTRCLLMRLVNATGLLFAAGGERLSFVVLGLDVGLGRSERGPGSGLYRRLWCRAQRDGESPVCVLV